MLLQGLFSRAHLPADNAHRVNLRASFEIRFRFPVALEIVVHRLAERTKLLSILPGLCAGTLRILGALSLEASVDSSVHVGMDEMASEDADAVLAASSVTDEANHSGAESAAESDDPDAPAVAGTGTDVTAAEALDSTDEPSRD